VRKHVWSENCLPWPGQKEHVSFCLMRLMLLVELLVDVMTAGAKRACIVLFHEVDAIGGARGGGDDNRSDNEVQGTMLQVVTKNRSDDYTLVNLLSLITV